MFVQKGILKNESNVESLFVHKDGQTQSFDTYFNSLNLFLIKHYTDGKKLTINVDYEGEGCFTVFYKFKNNVKVLYTSQKLTKQVEIDLSVLDECGIVYPVFKGNFKINSFIYCVDAESKNISTGVILTTFNRQEFLFPNLYKLNSCNFVDKVIIVDNAKNVVLPKELSSEKFVIVPNSNLGGTGGFTKGMMKAKDLGLSHFFIMDDDITLLPDVIDKAISLISCLNENHKDDWLGFSMLPNGSPTIQYELGTKWNGIKMLLNHHNLDLSNIKNLEYNQINKKYNYSAWWSLIMPSTVVDKYGYPFPFFIKFDDIEFGLRRKNEEIILTNGFGVWHEDFDKKYNPYLEYYLYRNALVTNSLHDSKPMLHSLTRYMGKCVKSYFKGKFIAIKLINYAINDFLCGPNFFENLDIEKQNIKIRRLAQEKINILKGIFCYPVSCCYYFFKLLLGFRKAKKKYNENFDKLSSEKYWVEVFKNAQ